MPYRQTLWTLGLFTVSNVVLFVLYRTLFARLFGKPASRPETRRLLLRGLRLDIAWLGVVLGVTTLGVLAVGSVSQSVLFGALWLVTGIHLFVSVANLCTFAERNQCAGELLLPYITSPYEVYLAVIPFIRKQWMVMLAQLVFGCGYFWSGLLLWRSVSGERLSIWHTGEGLIGAVALLALSILPCLHLVPRRKATSSGKARRGGWRLTTTKAKYYMDFTDYAFNQAVANPLLEFVFQQVPSHFKATVQYRLSETEALEVWRTISGHAPVDVRYPLLRRIRGRAESRIENLVIIQVEGFSQSMLEQQINGRVVMPFVQKLAREGYYFPNTLQCANCTSGGVFSTLTSMPQATYDEPGRRFASHELNGYYGSPARIFGSKDYTHFFLFGFRQSCYDFTAFAANQGCDVTGYFEFAEILKRKGQLAEADTLLGVFDGYFLNESAEILLRCPHRFTAHLTTTTTHSPWTVPQSFAKRFEEPAPNAFAYLDASIQKFCERLQTVPGLWEKTLVVILGDHTSVTFGNGWSERFRIPLVFYNPDLPPRANPDRRWASQVDVLPTALALFAGEHWCAGMGRNLLDPAVIDSGLVTGTSAQGYYLKNNFVLAYERLEREARVFELKNDALTAAETIGEHTENAALLRKQYFATRELAKRLAANKQIFPFGAESLGSMPEPQPDRDVQGRAARGSFR